MRGEKHFEKIEFNKPIEANTELRSRYNHQINRKRYSTRIPEARPAAPMLCTEFVEVCDTYPHEVYVQPKLDGFRCLGTNEYLISRSNSKFSYLEHIKEALKSLPPEITLDGELYVPNTKFQDISSIIRTETFNQMHLQLEYHVYDIADETLQFHERLELLQETFESLKAEWGSESKPFGNCKVQFPIRLVDTALVHLPEVTDCFKTMVEEGMEGLIVRVPNTKYEYGIRSRGLSRIKPFDQTMFKIIDVVPNKLRKKEAKFVMETTGLKLPFECSIKADTAIRTQILQHKEKFIGKWALVEHQGFLNSKKPRCPVCIKPPHLER